MKLRYKTSDLILFSSIIYIIVMCIPIFQAKGTVLNSIVAFCFMLFFMGLLFRHKMTKYTIILCFLITIFNYLIYKTQWSGEVSFLNKMLLLYEFWFPLFLAMFILRDDFELKRRHTIRNVIIFAYSVSCVTTIIGNLRYEIPSRFLATPQLDPIIRYKYRLENIGGFGFCYLAIYFSPLILDMILKTKKKVYYIPLALSIINAVLSEYFILIIILSIMFFLIMFDNLNYSQKSIFIFIGLICFFVFILNFDSIFNWLIDITQSTQSIQRRVREIYETLKSSSVSTSSDVYYRQEDYGKSWKLFFNNPFIGGWFNSEVGRHSEVIDLLGSMGLFGVGLVLTILMSIVLGIKDYYFYLDQSQRRVVKLMIVPFVLIAFLNPVLTSREIGLAPLMVIAFILPSKREICVQRAVC